MRSAVGTSHSSLVPRATSRITAQAPVRDTASSHLEALVVLLEHQPVALGVRAEHVVPDLVGPVGGVVHGVEERRRVARPRPAVVRARHDLGQVLAARQVAEAQPVHLVAREVDRPGEPATVRADLDMTGLAVARAGAVVDGLQVQQHLLRAGLVQRLAHQRRMVGARRRPVPVPEPGAVPRRERLGAGHARHHLGSEALGTGAEPPDPPVVVVPLGGEVRGHLRQPGIRDPGVRLRTHPGSDRGRNRPAG